MGKYKIYLRTTNNTPYEGIQFLEDKTKLQYYSAYGQIGVPEKENNGQVITLKNHQYVGSYVPDSPDCAPFSYLDSNIGSLTTDLHLNSFRVHAEGGSGNGLVDRLPQDLRTYMLNNDEHYHNRNSGGDIYPNYSNIKRNMRSIKGCESMFNYGATAFGSFITIPKVDSIGNVIKGDEYQDIYNVDNKNDAYSKNELFTI